MFSKYPSEMKISEGFFLHFFAISIQRFQVICERKQQRQKGDERVTC